MKRKHIVLIIIGIIVLGGIIISFIGTRDSTPIVSGVISNTSFSTYKEFEDTTKPETLSVNDNIFATVHFIESPTGKKYDVRWMQNDKIIQQDTVEVTKGTEGVLTSQLKSQNLAKGKLKVSFYYEGKDEALYTMEIELR